MKARLIISIPIEAEDEESVIRIGLDKIKTILYEVSQHYEPNSLIPDDSQFSLARDGDRSGKNLLLPKLEGRTGDHFDSRKATKKDLV